MDFRLKDYLHIIDTALDAKYTPHRIGNILAGNTQSGAILALRHDVDRRPENALRMAEAEAERGVKATYYFRIVPVAFKPAIIERIADLGHEIGYHYEDFHLAKYDSLKAADLFRQHLAMLREIAPVQTIAMHGSPLARFNNMKLWEYTSYEEEGVQDCILSHDWSEYVFFTDTGRSFDAGRLNLRDKIGGQKVEGVRSSPQVADYLRCTQPEKVQLSTHPERWNDDALGWTTQLGKDMAANSVKLILRGIRGGK